MATTKTADTSMPSGSIKRKLINALPFYLALAVTWTHVLLSPYTKVEESFTLHAVHDVLLYGRLPEYLPYWDHITFPGAVPRSFLPPIMLGGLVLPFSSVAVAMGWIKTRLGVQVLVRLVLATVFSGSFHHLASSVGFRFGGKVKWWFTALTLSSFHIPYYAGRTIPNFMALPAVMLSISLTLRSAGLSIPRKIKTKRLRSAVVLLTAVSTVVRLEIALFLLPVVLSLVLRGRLSLSKAVTYGVLGGVGSLACSAPIDYLLWRPTLTHPSFPFCHTHQIVWPELSGLVFNFFNDKASDWGIMSRHYYFTNSLPKLLVGTAVPLSVAGLLWIASMVGIGKGNKWMKTTARGVDEVMWTFGPGVVGLIGGMSLIGHKEWRFIVYALPVLVLLASIASAALWDAPSPRLRPLIRLGLVGIVGANLLFTGISTFLSMYNYPGGEVWRALEDLHLPPGTNDTLTIHYTAYPLQTGASLFTFLHLEQHRSTPFMPDPIGPTWVYDKSEDPLLSSPVGVKEAGVEWDVLVTDDWGAWDGKGWKLEKTIEGLAGLQRGGNYGVEVQWEDKIGILSRVLL